MRCSARCGEPAEHRVSREDSPVVLLLCDDCLREAAALRGWVVVRPMTPRRGPSARPAV